MVEQLDELYREVILDHFKSSAHAGTIPGAQIHQEGANPLCGDEVAFDLKLDGGHIQQVRFKGHGCAISQAASSMLAAQLEGKSLREAAALIEAMKGLMQGVEPAESIDLGDLEALAGVRKFPVRIKCAALSWNVVEQGLSEYSRQQTAHSTQKGQHPGS
ncbi:MAG: SUF system NifU family Fe-S cluster assembly protein [Candidatus Omnitrophica bacterium]|nr:SUF system NifU family Fe-S cluster assembly protein [Candidatus Omnitrophota bacterium]